MKVVKAEFGSLGGLYQAITINGFEFGGSTSMQIMSSDLFGRSSRGLNLTAFLT